MLVMGSITEWILDSWIGEGQTYAEGKERDRSPRNRNAEPASVERAGLELLLAPDHTAEDGRGPREIVPRDSETEQRRSSRRRNQTQQSQHRGQESTAQRRPHGDIPKCLANGPKELAKRQRAVSAEGPALARSGDEDADAHQELHDHEQGHHAEGAVLAQGVVVDLRHGLAEGGGQDGGGVGVHARGDHDREDEAEEPAGPDRHDDAVGDGAGGVGGFFGHVYAGVEGADAGVGC